MPRLRIANVAHEGTDVLVLEHRGSLISVPILERLMSLDASPVRFVPHAEGFRHRVFSLGMAGLAELMDCLGDGPVPAEAILDPRACLFYPPTVANPGLLEFSVRADDAIPRFRWGNGRCLRGHGAPLPVPRDEQAPEVSVQIAAVLGEDLRDATPQQATAAIAGFCTLMLWTFPSRERVFAGWGRYRLGQLGPFLVVPDERFDPTRCAAKISVNGQEVAHSAGRPWRASFPEMVAIASEGVDLLAGDVVATGPMVQVSSDGSHALQPADHITGEVDVLGAISGVVVPACKSER